MNDYYTPKMIQAMRDTFAYGKITDYACLGDVLIVEYQDDENKTRYATYIEGNSTHTSYDNLEYAIIDTIARKHDGINTQAGMMFMRMIKERD